MRFSYVNCKGFVVVDLKGFSSNSDYGFVIHGNLRGNLDVKRMLETVETKKLSGKFICCINV